jgi:hypothetical protein
VQLVIADTGPINYLVLIGHIGILPALFRKVILPAAGQRPKESACIGDDGRDQSSRSRNNSDSSPSLLFVDSNKSVDGGRRPE